MDPLSPDDYSPTEYESPLAAEVIEGDLADDDWSTVLVMGCGLLLFGFLLSIIFISVVTIFSDTEFEDDIGQGGAESSGSGGSNGSTREGDTKDTTEKKAPSSGTSATLRLSITTMQTSTSKITEIRPVSSNTTPFKTTAPAPPTPTPTTPRTSRLSPLPTMSTPKHVPSSTPKLSTSLPRTSTPNLLAPTTSKPTTSSTIKPTPTTPRSNTPTPTTPTPTTPITTTTTLTTPVTTTPTSTPPTIPTPMATTITQTAQIRTTPAPTTSRTTTPKTMTRTPPTSTTTTPKPTTPTPTTLTTTTPTPKTQLKTKPTSTTRLPTTTITSTPKPTTSTPTTPMTITTTPTTPMTTTPTSTTRMCTTMTTTPKPTALMTTTTPTTPMTTMPTSTTRTLMTPMTTTPKHTPPTPTTPMATTTTPTIPMTTTPKLTTPTPTTPLTTLSTTPITTSTTSTSLMTTPTPTTPMTTTPMTTTPKPTTPTSTTWKTTMQTTTPKVTTSTFTTTPSTSMQGPTASLTPLIERPPTVSSVICTLDGGGPIEVPDDGVCDFIFYDSLGDPFDRLGKPARGSFKKFQTLAAKGQLTQYGVSIFPLDIFSFLTLLNRATSIAWSEEKLWSHNIYHWGILSIIKTIMESPGYFLNATVALAKAADISKPSITKRVVSYTFLGFYVETSAGCIDAVQLMATHHRPAVLVILGHISFKEEDVKDEVSDYVCLMVPPIIYKTPSSAKNALVYGHTIMDAAKLLACIATNLEPLPVVGISLTMKGRWYTPKVDDVSVAAAGNYSVFEECKRFQEYGVPQLICNYNGTQYYDHMARNSEYLYWFTYDKSPGRKQTFTFDDARNLKEKMCHVIYNSTLDNYTFMPYDVNYDYAPSNCPHRVPGSYRRLHNVKQLIQFLLKNSKNQSFRDCTRT